MPDPRRRLCHRILLPAALLMVLIGPAQAELATSHPAHLAQPAAGTSLGAASPRMKTTRHSRGVVLLGAYVSEFHDSVQAVQGASLDCARGLLRPRLPGRYRVAFADRSVEAALSSTVTDPNGRLMNGEIYAVTDYGSSACVVWRVIR